MTICRTLPLLVALMFCPCYGADRLVAADGAGFRDVLELAGIGPDRLTEIPDPADYGAEDWQNLIRLVHRLEQYSTSEQDRWAIEWTKAAERLVGDLYDVVGSVEAIEAVPVPEQLAEAHGIASLYSCQVRMGDSIGESSQATGTVLSTGIPAGWQGREVSGEPIGFRGILLVHTSDGVSPVATFLTTHLGWFPRQGVPAGQLLLARQGMDVALFDEVKHRRPFVGPEVSREGDAFYSCLAAIRGVDSNELAQLSRQSVAQLADQWQAMETADRNQPAIVAEIRRRSDLGFSSVAPLFLQPEEMVGRLVRLEGTARRAVQIAVADDSRFSSYCELEVFPPDSQNLPVVCCVNELPAGFPTGDMIREPVQVVGVFFKSWLYRSRTLDRRGGETGRQQRLYTPVVVASRPTWLRAEAGQTSSWGLWGGVVVLAILGVVVLNAIRLARRDRRARSARQWIDVTNLE